MQPTGTARWATGSASDAALAQELLCGAVGAILLLHKGFLCPAVPFQGDAVLIVAHHGGGILGTATAHGHLVFEGNKHCILPLAGREGECFYPDGVVTLADVPADAFCFYLSGGLQVVFSILLLHNTPQIQGYPHWVEDPFPIPSQRLQRNRLYPPVVLFQKRNPLPTL